MVVEMACQCDDLPSHSHIASWVPVEAKPGQPPGMRAQYFDTGEVRIWVDWKAVARALLTGETDAVRVVP